MMQNDVKINLFNCKIILSGLKLQKKKKKILTSREQFEELLELLECMMVIKRRRGNVQGQDFGKSSRLFFLFKLLPAVLTVRSC